MHNKKIAVLASALILVMAACSHDNTKPQTQAQPSSVAPLAVGDNSQNALDWAGTYIGTLPCASCEGIATRIRLDKALRYTLSERYLGKSDQPMLTEGTFVWNADGNSITLQGIAEGARSTKLQVGENRITQLDLQGAKIEGALAEKYVLSKTADSIAGKHWKLVELGGKLVSGNAEQFFLKLYEAEGRVQAKAGCNNIVGEYSIANNVQIHFSKMVMTRMACLDMSLENELAKALESADNFAWSGNNLSLNRARMAPLARFELVQ